MRKDHANRVCKIFSNFALLIIIACSLYLSPHVQARDDSFAEGQRFDLIARIGGTRWAIILEPLYGGDSSQVLRDTITFSLNEFSSIRFAAEGFKTADVVVSTKDGEPVWTALQANPLKGVVFWKGRVYGEQLEGTVSRVPLEGKIQDYRFEGEEVHDPVIVEESADESLDPALTREDRDRQQDEVDGS